MSWFLRNYFCIDSGVDFMNLRVIKFSAAEMNISNLEGFNILLYKLNSSLQNYNIYKNLSLF